MRRIEHALTRIVIGLLVAACLYGVSLLAQSLPIATPEDLAIAQLAVDPSTDTVTVRSVAPDRLRICVEPRTGEFGRTECYRVGDIRAGRVEVRP